jgi:HAD superfamily hydrolase (TIGR01549 family)
MLKYSLFLLIIISCIFYQYSAFKLLRGIKKIVRKMEMKNSRNVNAIGILWDIDGTLSDSSRLGYTSTNEVLKRHSKDIISEEEYHEGTKYTTPRRLAWHVTGNPDDPIGQSLGQEFDELYVKLVSIETASFYDGMKDLVLSVAAAKPAVRYGALSNACTAYVEAVLAANDIDVLFIASLGADSVPAAKPAPDGLLLLCEKIRLLPERCVYIGDSPTDGQAAKAAGMHSIGVTWGSHSKERVLLNFVETVDSVQELQVAIQTFISSLSTTSNKSVKTEVAV